MRNQTAYAFVAALFVFAACGVVGGGQGREVARTSKCARACNHTIDLCGSVAEGCVERCETEWRRSEADCVLAQSGCYHLLNCNYARDGIEGAKRSSGPRRSGN
jgi:hypothetical protein